MSWIGWLMLGFFLGFMTCLAPALIYDWRDRKRREPWTSNSDWQ